MKRVTAIVRRDQLEAVEKRLQSVGVDGITVSQVKGYGECASFFSDDWLVPHTKIEIFAENDKVDAIVEAIREGARTGSPGDGLVAVAPVQQLTHIRTGTRYAAPPRTAPESIGGTEISKPRFIALAVFGVLALLAIVATFFVSAVHQMHYVSALFILAVVVILFLSLPGRRPHTRELDD